MKKGFPEERIETVRQELVRLLDDNKLTVSELSKAVGKSEKEIYDHLEQIKRSGLLVIFPSECSDCGYLFKERERVKKPGKCPKCKSTHIEQPLFSINSK